MSETTLVFDSAGTETFLWAYEKGKEQVFCEKTPRRSLLATFPAQFATVMNTVSVDSRTTAYLGIGPGSFTGLKSGASLFGSFLYARGVFMINLVSSLDLLAARAAPPVGCTCLTISPFHETDLFASLTRWEKNGIITIVPPTLVSAEDLASFVMSRSPSADFIVIREDIPKTISRSIAAHFFSFPRRTPSDHLSIETLSLVPSLATVDIRHDPLRLQYLAAPAALSKNDTTHYVSMV